MVLGDGSEARERLTLHERPHRFAYHVGPFTGPLRHLVDGADGAWWFAPAAAVGGAATAVTWTYTFRPRGLAPAARARRRRPAVAARTPGGPSRAPWRWPRGGSATA